MLSKVWPARESSFLVMCEFVRKRYVTLLNNQIKYPKEVLFIPSTASSVTIWFLSPLASPEHLPTTLSRPPTPPKIGSLRRKFSKGHRLFSIYMETILRGHQSKQWKHSFKVFSCIKQILLFSGFCCFDI